MSFQLLCLTFTLAISKSDSQIMTVTAATCISAGTQVTLKCNTTDFASTILFYLNTVNKGGCVSGTCMTGISGYNTPTQTGVFTEMIISQYDHSRDGGSWTCTYAGTTSNSYTLELGNCVVTTERTREGNSPCDGCLKAIRDWLLCSCLPALVKILIILYLWCKPKKVKIIVITRKEFLSAKQTINKEKPKDIPHVRRDENYVYTIVVRAGELLQCGFQTDSKVLTLSFKINDDVLCTRPGQNITLPTVLDVIPQYSTITWELNGMAFPVVGRLYNTIVAPNTYGDYAIKMTFSTLNIDICIQNMKVQESKPCCLIGIRTYRRLMTIFLVIDIVLGVIGGIVIGSNRSTDGYCVSVIVIIVMVLLPMIVFTCVEVALFLMLIKRSENKESSGSTDSTLAMMSTSTTSTVSPNAGTTTGQNSRNWQPPNNNMAVNSDVHQ